MASEFKLRHQVQFVDTDLAGIVHFSNFFRYMEITEHAFYRSLGIRIHSSRSKDINDTIGLPRVHAACDYLNPIRFEDLLDIQLKIRKITEKSIHYEIDFFRILDAESVIAARGKLVVVCIMYDGKLDRLKSMPIPKSIREKIEISPDS